LRCSVDLICFSSLICARIRERKTHAEREKRASKLSASLFIIGEKEQERENQSGLEKTGEAAQKEQREICERKTKAE